MQVPLTGGAYQSRSLMASAQRSVNLYQEANPDGSVFPFTYYPTPGLTLLGQAPTPGPVRGLYAATNGILYAVVGATVYTVDSSWLFTSIGEITELTTPVSMVDNGLCVIIVDGSAQGWAVPLGGAQISPITDPAFYGATRVDAVDTFFVFNKPGTIDFYISPSEYVNDGSTPFDPLYVAAKAASPDKLIAPIVLHRNIWFIGDLTAEVWYNAGAPDFPFQILDGAYIEQGCTAPYSIAKQDGSVFWLSHDRRGQRMVLMGSGYTATRVSTHAIEAVWEAYQPNEVLDAIGFCYQQGGHGFYMLTFPTANRTWCFDLATSQWHERDWTDPNGFHHRHRANCFAMAYYSPVVGDWQTGAIYSLDESNYTDNGAAIIRVRGFPHLASDGNRVFYTRLLLEMEVGNAVGTSDGLPTSSGVQDTSPTVTMRYSDTRGQSWGMPLQASMGGYGDFLTSIQWRRLGMARDRVFEIEFSAPVRTALMGAYVETEASET